MRSRSGKPEPLALRERPRRLVACSRFASRGQDCGPRVRGPHRSGKWNRACAELQIGQERVARLLADLPVPSTRPAQVRSPCGTSSQTSPILIRPLGRNPLSRDDQRKGRSPAEEPWQVDGSAVDERHAPAAAGDGKSRLRLGQADVSVAEEFETARVRVALRDGDHRFDLHEPRPAHRAGARRLRFIGDSDAGKLFEARQIGPRTERLFRLPRARRPP